MANAANTQDIISVSLRKAIQELGVQTISPLRSNVSGYPYVTLVTKERASLNLYFGKNSANMLPVVGSKIIHLLKDATIVQSLSEDKDGNRTLLRYKLSIPKAGSAATGYAAASEMADLFGTEEVSAFNMQDFKSLFQTKAAVAVGTDGEDAI